MSVTKGPPTFSAPRCNILPWPVIPTCSRRRSQRLRRNLSGFMYEGSGSAIPGVLWECAIGPGTLFRLVGTALLDARCRNGWEPGSRALP